VIGKSQDDAKQALAQAGFEVRVESSPDTSKPVDQVVDQNPAPNTSAPKGSTVTIFVSNGPAAVTVPDVSGDSLGQAQATLQNAGFETSTTSEADDSTPSGRVIRTEPPAGSQRPKGATITIVVSSGTGNVTVPSVIGLSQANATAVLENKGFEVDVQEQEVLDPSKDGKVIDQDPNSGASRPSGATVTITVGQAVTSSSSTSTTA
jgi:serine/threonine-protein kinase